jgi:hypothetical protein
MENQTTPEKKQEVIIKPLQFYLLLLLSCAAIFFVGYVYHDSLEQERQAHTKTQIQLANELSGKTSCIATKDSLKRENAQLSVYKALTKAIVHRDEAATLLTYKAGQTAHLKRDSSRVTITGIIVGGNKYNYFIQYSVEYPDGKPGYLDPTLIY